jgi:hypothetical protein
VAFLLAAGLWLGFASPGVCMPLANVGIGAYGVTNVPIVQDDAETGGLFGIRGRVGLLSLLSFEPSVNFFQNKDADVEGVTLEAPEVTSYAFNLVLKTGPLYTTGGIGWSSVDVPGGVGESDEATYNVGGGLELGFGKVAIDVSPRLFIINTEDKASRKNLAIMAGINYYIF